MPHLFLFFQLSSYYLNPELCLVYRPVSSMLRCCWTVSLSVPVWFWIEDCFLSCSFLLCATFVWTTHDIVFLLLLICRVCFEQLKPYFRHWFIGSPVRSLPITANHQNLATKNWNSSIVCWNHMTWRFWFALWNTDSKSFEDSWSSVFTSHVK